MRVRHTLTCPHFFYDSSFLKPRHFRYRIILLIHQHLSVRRHSLNADVHLLTRGVVEELHLGFALGIGGDVRLPPDGAAEVRHWRNHAIVLRLECGGLVEALKVGAAESLVTISVIFNVFIEIYNYVIFHIARVTRNNVDGFHVIQPHL